MFNNIIQYLKTLKLFNKKDLALQLKVMKDVVGELELKIIKMSLDAEDKDEDYAITQADLKTAIEKKDALIAFQHKRISDLISSRATTRNATRRQKPSKKEVISHLRQTRNMRLPRKGASSNNGRSSGT